MKRSPLRRKTELKADPEKAREWKRRSKELKRTGGPKRKTRMKTMNRKRKKERRAKDFGDKAEWLRKNVPCEACGKLPTEPHHYPSRGAGGTAEHLTALCAFHHRQFHTLGAESWQELHHVDLTEAAKRTQEEWEARR